MSDSLAGIFADGAPVNSKNLPTPQPATSTAKRPTLMRAASRIQTFEGPRGYSIRATEVFRHVWYFFVIVGCVAIANWAFSDIPQWRAGGMLMLYSLTTILVTAAIGSVLYADCRHLITEQWRHFTFGIIALPGTALALFMKVVSQALTSPSQQQDSFVTVLTGNGLPLSYMALMSVSTIIFVRYIFGGLRSINRGAMTDEEEMATWMRQDGGQR